MKSLPKAKDLLPVLLVTLEVNRARHVDGVLSEAVGQLKLKGVEPVGSLILWHRQGKRPFDLAEGELPKGHLEVSGTHGRAPAQNQFVRNSSPVRGGGWALST